MPAVPARPSNLPGPMSSRELCAVAKVVPWEAEGTGKGMCQMAR